ncbi:MAG TPA: ABC transporter permease subunit, partial [Planctomycetaceae bacterium]|nr:ABC transporter permease subunit [Planctomycetaceae bacterium]
MSAAEISTPLPSASPWRTVRACLFLFRLTLQRQFFSRQTLVNLGLAVVCGLIVAAWSHRGSRTVAGLCDFMLLPTFINFLMPIFAISYGSSTIGGEREVQSLIYLLVTPIPRMAIYFTKALSVSLLVTAWTTG